MPSDTAAKFVLKGHVVTMNDAFDNIARGAVYVSGNAIAAVQTADAPAPPGFEGATAVDTKGVIYPGLVELHNHLSYNALRLWSVPKKYGSREEWPDDPGYHQLVTGPMSVLGKSRRADLLASLVRYVESKCLFGGVTTSQGVALSSNAGIERYYKGVVRNVEQADDKAFPPSARTHIADVVAKDWQKFFEAISGNGAVILHLAEGTNDKARSHFLALQNGDRWAITPRLVGIHCAALKSADFDVMAKHGGSMVWSPLSNLLLYGATADVVAAKKSGVPIALGSDWSPSGSKSLFGELKVARLAADAAKADFQDRDVVAMATRTPAKMVGWDGLIGSVEAGKRADLLVLGKDAPDPYKALLAAHEDDIALVVIDGVARYGTTALMTALGATFTTVDVVGQKRGVQYHDPSANPDIDSVTLAEAQATLKTFFGGLPDPPAPKALAPTAHAAKVHLVLEELEATKVQRPMLPYRGHATGWSPAAKLLAAEAKPLQLTPLDIDPLTVKDDDKFVPLLQSEKNLPDWLKAGLKKAF
jgi:cytosine/adenosine deaminase-related metal-dependent hydrolase